MTCTSFLTNDCEYAMKVYGQPCFLNEHGESQCNYPVRECGVDMQELFALAPFDAVNISLQQIANRSSFQTILSLEDIFLFFGNNQSRQQAERFLTDVREYRNRRLSGNERQCEEVKSCENILDDMRCFGKTAFDGLQCFDDRK